MSRAVRRIVPPARLPLDARGRGLPGLALIASLAVAITAGVAACGGDRPTPPPGVPANTPGLTATSDALPARAEGPGPHATASHASEPSAVPPDVGRRVEALVEIMRHRVRCNRIMGCEAAEALRALGPAAVDAVAAQLRAAPPKDDGWWLIELVRTLGELGRVARGPARALAREALEATLLDPRDELRGRAALALGRLGAPASRPAIESALGRWRERGDAPATVGALLFALERASRPSRALRRQFVALLPADETQLGRVNAGALALLADVARAWDLPQAAPGLRIVARHRARPARLAAVRALGALRDTGALKLLQDRLSDEIPAIRRAAVRSLQEVTGNTAYDTADAWRAWWTRRQARRAVSHDAGSRPSPALHGPTLAPGQGASRALDGRGSVSPSSRGSGQRGTATRAR